MSGGGENRPVRTREKKPWIRTLDRPAVLAGRMKRTLVRARTRAESLTERDSRRPEDEAEERLRTAAEETGSAADRGMRRTARMVREKVQERIRKARERKQRENVRTSGQAKDRGGKGTVPRRPVRRLETAGMEQGKPRGRMLPDRSTASSPGTTSPGYRGGSRILRPAHAGERAAVRSAGKTVKTASRTIRTGERTARTTVRTAQTTAKTARKTAEASARTAKATAAAVRKAAVAAYKAAVAIGKAVAAAVREIVSAVKGLAAMIAAGGWTAVLAIVILCMAALVIGSVFGILLLDRETEDGKTLPEVVREINAEYLERIEAIREEAVCDRFELSGSAADWREVLTVYAVTAPKEAADGAAVPETLDAGRLRRLFWEMHTLRSEVRTEPEGDPDGEEGTRTVLSVTVRHRSPEEMADRYGFGEDERRQMDALLDPRNRALWMSALYGTRPGEPELVAVARSQVGNTGGQPYWSWYGFGSRVEWCACFVSWCANECGYLEQGILPKFAGCAAGTEWFRKRGLWLDGTQVPEPGMIIFYDSDDPDGYAGPQDGRADHTGIVAGVEDGFVRTVEGNSYGDSCRENRCPVGHYEILGYGIPAFP